MKQDNIRVVGIRREHPDLKALARIFIELAQEQAKREMVARKQARTKPSAKHPGPSRRTK